MTTDEAGRDALHARLAPLVGEWSIEAAFPGAPPSEIRGRMTLAWTLGGAFLEQRSSVPHPDVPEGLCLIGPSPDGDAFTQHYFDSRGVARVYAMTFAGGRWTLLRQTPDFTPLAFHQRYVGTLAPDGDTIDGRWETSPDGEAWQLDFGLTYRRAA